MTIAAVPLTESLATLLKGQEVPWSAIHVTPAELLEACAEQDLTGLVHQRVNDLRPGSDWPKGLREDLAGRARGEAARELLRRREIASVLDALDSRGVRPVLLKGTPLAYTVYDVPGSRPRGDTDLLVRREQVDTIRHVMSGLGYVPTPYCDGELLFCQFELGKPDAFGVHHAFDFHWKISTQSMFADLLTYEELAADAAPVPALGPHARAAGPQHALLLACVHPVMHHRNVERLLWVYDIHLLASRLSDADLDRFADVAVAKEVAAISAHGLGLARSRFGSRIPDRVIARLAAHGTAEPSATYLQPERRWHDELTSCVRGLPRWRDRFRLLREVVLPDPRYMLRAYGVAPQTPGAALLPALYFHRVIRGIWKIFVGLK